MVKPPQGVLKSEVLCPLAEQVQFNTLIIFQYVHRECQSFPYTSKNLSFLIMYLQIKGCNAMVYKEGVIFSSDQLTAAVQSVI